MILSIWFESIRKCKIRLNHLNAFIRLIKRMFKKELSLRINISLITPVTKKPREVRMGKVKDSVIIEKAV